VMECRRAFTRNFVQRAIEVYREVGIVASSWENAAVALRVEQAAVRLESEHLPRTWRQSHLRLAGRVIAAPVLVRARRDSPHDRP
jgi:hypothetical protein